MTTKHGSDAWLDLVREPIIDPERPIIDPHHHLWDRPDSTYVLKDLWADTESGHQASMFYGTAARIYRLE